MKKFLTRIMPAAAALALALAVVLPHMTFS
jgi:hypothetical protein